MERKPKHPAGRDRVWLLALLLLLIFASPLLTFWSMPDSAWYLPYLLWLLIIVIAAWLQAGLGRHDP